MTLQPAARAAASLRAGVIAGKFQGVNAATGPIACRLTSCCTPGRLAGTTRPSIRLASSANHSKYSAARNTSSRLSAKGLPSSSVISVAMCSARSRINSAPRLRTRARSLGTVVRQALKAGCVADSARSRSAVVARGTRPSSWRVAGFTTLAVSRSPAPIHSPLMKR
ncbi:hypothetical protein D3C73_837350 [compost metagenome]